MVCEIVELQKEGAIIFLGLVLLGLLDFRYFLSGTNVENIAVFIFFNLYRFR
jgi:hypothetical protein